MSAGCGPLASMPAARAPLDRRRDLLDVLAAEQAVLAGVRVEPADGDPRRVEEPAQRRVGQLDHVEHPAGLHPLDRLAQRAVRADVGDGERAAVGEAGREHHRHPLHPAQLGDHLGVADERRVGELRRLLVHRHRDDPGDRGRRARPRWPARRSRARPRPARRVEHARARGRRRSSRPASTTREGAAVGGPRRRRRATTSRSTSRPSSSAPWREDRRVAVDDHVVAEPAGGEAAQHDLRADAGRRRPS